MICLCLLLILKLEVSFTKIILTPGQVLVYVTGVPMVTDVTSLCVTYSIFSKRKGYICKFPKGSMYVLSSLNMQCGYTSPKLCQYYVTSVFIATSLQTKNVGYLPAHTIPLKAFCKASGHI